METAATIVIIIASICGLFCIFSSLRSRIKNKIEEQSESFSERVVRRSIIINQDKKESNNG